MNRRWHSPAVSGRSGRKYRNKPTYYDGKRYDSKAEVFRAQQLDLMLDARHIRGWERQVKFELGVPENVYRADFVVEDKDGISHAEDVKGYMTSKFRRDLRLWRSYGPMPLWILKRRSTRWKIEIVTPALGTE